ncbi:MAG: ribosome biogenesis factor YjgA [Panacagrimonas sp.]
MQRRNDHRHESDDDAGPEGPSKTQLKQASQDLKNDLGNALLALSATQLDRIEMDPSLREALREHGRMPTREAKRRHMQYIGKLLRNTDTGPAQRAVLAIRAGESRLLSLAERWRERLMADDDALTDWIKAHPGTDAQPLRTLIFNARRELDAARTADPDNASAGGRGRVYRELFQAVRARLKASALAEAAASESDAETDAEADSDADLDPRPDQA